MPAKKAAVATVSEEQIRAIAHKLWLEAGEPEGLAEDHWFKAIELASAKAALSANKPSEKATKAKASAPKAEAAIAPSKKPATKAKKSAE